MKKRYLIICALLLFINFCEGQTAFPAFAKDILSFKHQDSIKTPPKNAILFVGSSSFARWTSMADDFPGYPIINRGFGGSTLTDVIRYAYDVIIPYGPKQVLIYCGDNDLAANVSVRDVVTRFKTLFQMIRTNLPETTIDFVSIKPSPLRQQLIAKMKGVNAQVKAFLKNEKNAGFIDVYSTMLDAKGKVKEDLFVEDRLHLNEKGYAIWKKIILPYLSK